MSARATHVVHLFSTFDAGGPQVRTAHLIGLLPDRFDHTIVAMDGRYGCKSLLPERSGIRCVELPFRTDTGWTAFKLGRFLRVQRPDLLCTYNWGAIEGILAGRFAKLCPMLHHEDGFGPDEADRQKSRRVFARRVLLDDVDAVFVASRNLERIAVDDWKLPKRRVHFIANGVDCARFRPGDRAESRAALGLPLDANLIGSVGGFRPEKDHDFLLDACVGLDAELVLVGEGPLRSNIEARIARTGVRAHLLGWVDDLVPVYRSLDLLAISSRTEQLPVALLEAMASALPVVSTDVGDVRVVLPASGHEWLCPVGDLTGFRERLAAMLADPRAREQLGTDNRERCASAFSQAWMAQQFLDLYDGLTVRS